MSVCKGGENCQCLLTVEEFGEKNSDGCYLNRDHSNCNLCGTCGHGVGFHCRRSIAAATLPPTPTSVTPSKSTSLNSLPSADRLTKLKLWNLLRNFSNPLFMNGISIGRGTELNEETLNASSLFLKLTNLSDQLQSAFELCLVLQVPVYSPTQDELAHVHSHFNLLNENKESKVQHLLSMQKLLHFYDFRDTSNQPAVYMMPDTEPSAKNTNSQRIERSGKPDAISLHGPLFLELKGTEWNKLEGLIQGIERVAASKHTYGLFDKHICLIKEPRGLCFLVWYEAQTESDLQEKDKPIRINLLSDIEFSKLFISVARHAQTRPSFFYNDCSAILLQVLHSLRLSWWHCQVLLLNALSSKIYQIVVGDRSCVLTDRTLGNSVVVKINPARDRYFAELGALQKLSQYYDSSKIDYYCLGYISTASSFCLFDGAANYLDRLKSPGKQRNADGKALIELSTLPDFAKASLMENDDKPIEAYMKEVFPLIEEYRLVSGDAWWNSSKLLHHPVPSMSFAGALVMKPGTPIQSLDQQVYLDVLDSLSVCHNLGIVHRDLRSCNILQFGDKTFVVDFDLCGLLPEGQFGVHTSIQLGSAQERKSPVRIRKEVLRLHQMSPATNQVYSIFWTKSDDILMFTEYFTMKLLNNISREESQRMFQL